MKLSRIAKILSLFFVALILSKKAFATPNATIIWKTQYDPSTAHDYAYATCSDGQYVYVVGYTSDEGDGDTTGSSVLIAKVDPQTGQVLATIKYEPYDGTADDDNDIPLNCVIVGNYLYVVGHTNAFGNYGRHIAKIDLTTFTKVAEYNYNYQSSYDDFWRTIDTDGTYLYVGGRYYDGSEYYFIVQKLDLDGNVLATWTVSADDTYVCRTGSTTSHGNDDIYTLKYYNGYIYVGGSYFCYGDWGGDGYTDDADYRTVIVKLYASNLTEITHTVKDWYTQTREGTQYEFILGLDVYNNYVCASGWFYDGSTYPGLVWCLDDKLNTISTNVTYSILASGVHAPLSKIKIYKGYVIATSRDSDGTYVHQSLRIFSLPDLQLLNTIILDNGAYNSKDADGGRFYIDASNNILYLGALDYAPGYGEWTIYALQLSGFGSINLAIQSPTNNQVLYTSKVNVSFSITNTDTSNNITTFYELYIDNNLYYNETVSIPAGQTINISKIAEVLSEGSHVLDIKVYDPAMQDYVIAESTFTLDLYDENATYSNYTTYNNTKYVDTLAYTISVRCGALNYNITIDAWNGKQYTITCDNTTKTITDSFRAPQEGQMDAWFKLNAVNSSDSRYFGNDSFVVDLNPPIIEYLNYTLQEGFRDNLTETAKYKVTDSISPLITCDYSFNSVQGTENVTNATEITHAFNITSDNSLAISCVDLVGHKTIKDTTFTTKIVNLAFKDDITSSDITITDNLTVIAIYGATTHQTTQQTKYYVAKYQDEMLKIIAIYENPNVDVVSLDGYLQHRYQREYISPHNKKEDNLTVFLSQSGTLYEVKITNMGVLPAVFGAILNDNKIAEAYAGSQESTTLFLPAGYLYKFVASDEAKTVETNFKTSYLTQPQQIIFDGLTIPFGIDAVKFTYENLGNNTYKIIFESPKPVTITYTVYNNSEVIETQTFTDITYFDRVYNLTTGVFRFVIKGDVNKEFTIYKPEGLPPLTSNEWDREVLAFLTGLIALGIIGRRALDKALILAGIIMILMAKMFATTLGITYAVGSVLLGVGVIFFFLYREENII